MYSGEKEMKYLKTFLRHMCISHTIVTKSAAFLLVSTDQLIQHHSRRNLKGAAEK